MGAGPIYEPLVAFEAGSSTPLAGLIRNTQGDSYGMSALGGAYDCGTIYKLSASGEMSVLVHFTGTSGAAKGSQPRVRLIRGGDGKFWGTTSAGGTYDFGTIFSLDPVSNTFTTVVEFTGPAGNAKGIAPQELTFDGSGCLWGATVVGGTTNLGTVFKFDPQQGAFSTVVEFTGNSGLFPGARPAGALALTPDGFLWGATSQGGNSDAGTVFKVRADTGAFTNMRKFSLSGGYDPEGGLIYDAGYVWGTTYRGYAFTFASGGVYRVNIETGEFSNVGVGDAPGAGVKGELVKDAEGQFWGATGSGGAENAGTIFKVNPAGAVTTVHQFSTTGATAGGEPNGSLWMDADGTFWGTTLRGGVFGTIFKIDPGAGYSTVHRFRSDVGANSGSNARCGRGPSASLVADAAGWLWGTTDTGGENNLGTVFRIHPVTREIVTGAQFTGTGPVPGSRPAWGLISDPEGSLFGTTSAGGTQFGGTVFKISPDSNLTTLFEGTLSRGSPTGLPLRDSAGHLWVTALRPGFGAILKIASGTNQVTTALAFTGTSGDRKGAAPRGGLVADQNGVFWGTTAEGGMNNHGTIFKWDPATGVHTLVAEFTGTAGLLPGKRPRARLTMDESGFLWGTTVEGGIQGFGTIFKVHMASGQVATMAQFSGAGGATRGSKPMTGLAMDDAGFLWGCTSAGGANDAGTVFKLSRSGAFIHVFDFTGNEGAIPGKASGEGSLTRQADGKIYGATTSGGVRAGGQPAGGGQVFRITPALYPIEEWKLVHLNDAHAIDDGDPDQDGVMTLAEYALLRLPEKAEAASTSPPVTVFTYPDGERLRMIVPRDPARDDITIEVQASSSVAGPFSTVASSIRGAPFSGPGYVTGDSVEPGLKQVEIRDTVEVSSEVRRFMRIKVIRE